MSALEEVSVREPLRGWDIFWSILGLVVLLVETLWGLFMVLLAGMGDGRFGAERVLIPALGLLIVVFVSFVVTTVVFWRRRRSAWWVPLLGLPVMWIAMLAALQAVPAIMY